MQDTKKITAEARFQYGKEKKRLCEKVKNS